MKEPDIIINGVRLTNSQAMTLRVAIVSFASEISEPDSLGLDEHGEVMRAAYLANATEIMKVMHHE